MSESPMLIPDGDFEPSINDLDVTDLDENKQLYKKLASSKKVKHVEEYDTNFELVQYGDKYVLLNHNKGTIDYYVKLEEGSYNLLGKWLTQVEVWRRYASEQILVAPYIFNDYILPKHGTVISDSLQTEGGKNLWIRLVFSMLKKGKNIYVYDRNQNTLTEITSSSMLDDMITGIYGTTKKFQHIRLVISDKELQ